MIEIGRSLKSFEGYIPERGNNLNVETGQVLRKTSFINIMENRLSIAFCSALWLFYHLICDLNLSGTSLISCYQCMVEFFFKEG